LKNKTGSERQAETDWHRLGEIAGEYLKSGFRCAVLSLPAGVHQQQAQPSRVCPKVRDSQGIADKELDISEWFVHLNPTTRLSGR
jgi:hypothetical protein